MQAVGQGNVDGVDRRILKDLLIGTGRPALPYGLDDGGGSIEAPGSDRHEVAVAGLLEGGQEAAARHAGGAEDTPADPPRLHRASSTSTGEAAATQTSASPEHACAGRMLLVIKPETERLVELADRSCGADRDERAAEVLHTTHQPRRLLPRW